MVFFIDIFWDFKRIQEQKQKQKKNGFRSELIGKFDC